MRLQNNKAKTESLVCRKAGTAKEEKSDICLVSNVGTILLPYSIYQFSAQAILCQAHGGWQNKKKRLGKKEEKKHLRIFKT